ncbi:SHSA4 protein, partial [Probosciger aterrimus]|nr:SHSA4 protein [Probosciger aterrimus]
MGPGGPGSAWPLAGTVLVAVAASLAAAGEDCLWYVDRNGSWHPGFECQFLSFCCGSCHQRFCCRDPLRLITERQQRHCLAF